MAAASNPGALELWGGFKPSNLRIQKRHSERGRHHLIDLAAAAKDSAIVTSYQSNNREEDLTMNDTPQVVQEKISKWLTEERYSVRQEPHSDLHWLLIAAGGLAPLQIGQPTHDRVDIQIEFRIGHAAKFAELSAEKQSKYLKRIFVAIIGLGLQSHGLQQNLDGLLITSSFFLDALTKDYFMSHVQNVLNGAALVRMILADAQADIMAALDSDQDQPIH